MGNEFITIIRPSFMRFCCDACRAAALNHLLFRIAGKSKDQPKEKIQAGDILWYARTEQITEEMSNAWGVCKVRKEVNGLIKMGLVGRRVNPTWGADRTKHFCFGTEQCEKFVQLCQKHDICVVHLGLPPEVMHLIYSSNANDKSIKCICAIHQMELMEVSDANDKYIEAIPIDSPSIDDYQDDNKEGNDAVSGETDAPFSDEERIRLLKFGHKVAEKRVENGIRVTGEHPAVHVATETASQYPIADSYSAIGNIVPPVLSLPSKGVSHAQNQDTADLPGRGVRGADSGPDHRLAHRLDTSEHAPGTPALPSAVTPPGDRHGATGSVQAPSSERPDPAQPALSPQRSGTPSATSAAQVAGRKRRTVPERPQLKSDPREVQERINAHRGYELEEKVELIRERQAIQAWCSKHSIEEYERVMRYLTTQDKYWKLEENKYRIGGLTLAKETPKALAAVQRNGKHPEPGWSAEHPPADNDYSLTAQLWRQEHARGTK